MLGGIEFLPGSAKGDSSLVPSAYKSIFPHVLVNKISYVLLGPDIGYGHTFVIKRHLFITTIGALNADV